MKFIGTVENLIYYKWRDIYAVRTKPTKVKQTKASIEQSKLFGIAAHTGAVLRNVLKPALPDAKDLVMMRRFEQAIVSWLRTGGVYKSNEPQAACNCKPYTTKFYRCIDTCHAAHKRYRCAGLYKIGYIQIQSRCMQFVGRQQPVMYSQRIDD